MREETIKQFISFTQELWEDKAATDIKLRRFFLMMGCSGIGKTRFAYEAAQKLKQCINSISIVS